MIAKHVPMKSIRKSDFGALVRYITNPQQKSERVGQVSVTNCQTDRVDASILEVLNTQAQNRRARADKTYHLIVSFRAGEQPEAATLKAVEGRLCEGLGYGEHQRVSAVHYDTDNLHLHIAINKIHPSRYTIHNPYNDHKTLAQLCETMERDYGLEPDNHRAQRRGAENRAQDMERHAGIESLLGWIKRECLGQIQNALTWAELHQVLRDNGLEICERANGLVITDGGGTMVKASSLGRDLSKAKLEARLGAFEPGPELGATKPSRRYEPRPVRTRIDTSELYAKYGVEQERLGRERQAQSLAARRRKSHAIDAAKRAGRLKRSVIKLMVGGDIGKRGLYALTSKGLKDEIHKIVKRYNAECELIQKKYRHEAWADWLRRKATEGDGAALAALRAREAAQELKGNTLTGQKRRVNGAPDATNAISAMPDSITKKGTVIYRIGTSAIRDDGVRLAVSRGVTPAGLEAAMRMATQRYGNRLTVNGSDEFKDRLAKVAANKGLPVTFADAALERRRRSLFGTTVRSLGTAARSPIDEGMTNEVLGFGISKTATRKNNRKLGP
jgi:TraI-like middle domain/MobA/VirD2-like, nuclease domain/Large polyvalent protein-associated domain 7